jgi:hypothetical protein
MVTCLRRVQQWLVFQGLRERKELLSVGNIDYDFDGKYLVSIW